MTSEGSLRRRSDPAAAAAKSARAAVAKSGVTRLCGCLSEATATALRTYVLEELQTPGTDLDVVAVQAGTQRLSRLAAEGGLAAAEKAGEFRWDMRLSLDAPPVRRALRELLVDGSLGEAIHRTAGPASYVFELAAVVSARGAPPQVVQGGAFDSPSVTAFVALQPVRRDTGATRFLPGTHTDAAAARSVLEKEEAVVTQGGGPPPASCVALLDTGDAALFDGRVLHCALPHRWQSAQSHSVSLYLTVGRLVHAATSIDSAPPSLRELVAPPSLRDLVESLSDRSVDGSGKPKQKLRSRRADGADVEHEVCLDGLALVKATAELAAVSAQGEKTAAAKAAEEEAAEEAAAAKAAEEVAAAKAAEESAAAKAAEASEVAAMAASKAAEAEAAAEVRAAEEAEAATAREVVPPVPAGFEWGGFF